MFKFKNKINDIWNMVKKNKRLKYLSLISILVLFCLALNVTFARYTTSKNNKSANITIGDLKYQMIINDTKLGSSVGTKVPSNTIIGDRIILSKAGKTEQFNIMLTSLNNFDTKYEITYRVCTDKNCTKFIDTPKSLSIMYGASTPYISGTLGANKNIFVSLITDNTDSKDYYIQIDLNVGYSHNNLALQNKISTGYIEGILEGDLEILAYVNGVEVENFPKDDNYNASVSCLSPGNSTSNIVSTVSWNGTKWVINVASIDSRNTVCRVYFTKKSEDETKAPTGWYTSAGGTLLAAIKRDNVVGTAATNPGKEMSVESEKIFASTPDDYGTSFYYRGAVDNNYVVFAGMCWRIVRVTGNGSIKLTLHNRNESNASNPCSVTGGATLAYALYDGTNSKTYFNSANNLNQYVGFMYGTNNSVSTYAEAFENNIDSTILVNLKKWYDLKLRNYNDMLADTIWCNDKSTTSNIGSTGNMRFDASSRAGALGSDGYWYPAKGTGPSLICKKIDKEGVDPNLSRFTANDTLNGNGKLKGSNGNGGLLYKIGLLTYDEVAFAGSVFASLNWNYNRTYYLYENAGDGNWWTMTPMYTASDYSDIIYVANNHRMIQVFPQTNLYLRPAISLLTTTKISKGKGSSSDPYVVKMS